MAIPSLQHIVFAGGPSGTWVDGDAPVLQIGEQLPDGSAHDCFPSSFVYHSFTNPDGSFNSIGRDVTKDACVTQNPLGFFGSTSGGSYDFIRPGTNIAFRVIDPTGRLGSVRPIPGQPKFLYSFPDNNPDGGSSLRFYDNFSSAGTFSQVLSNVNELAFRFATPLKAALKDDAQNNIYMSASAFSSNGEWMVIEAFGIGFIRLNTQTLQMQLISTERYNYGLGIRPALTLAISDDGKTVLRSSTNVSATVAYDLSACQASSIIPNKPAGVLTPGCRSRSLQADLSQQASGFVGFLNMQFSADGNSVRGVVAKNNASGVREYFSMNYSIAGYQPPHLAYLALGDSFSSGEGALDDSEYELGTDTPENNCHLSKKSYPYLITQALSISSDDFHSVACSGAKIRHYMSDDQHHFSSADVFSSEWLPGTQAQALFVGKARPGVVTISMVGNDIGFSGKIIRCLAPDSCFHFKEDRQSIVNEINGQFDNLVGMYADIRSKSNNAKVYVLGYPQMFSTTGDCALVNLDQEERETAKGLVGYLNAVIKAATQKAGVQYIDVEQAFEGHQLCGSGKMAMSGLSSGNDKLGIIGNESFHPNEFGHELFAQQLLLQSQNLTRQMQQPDNSATVPSSGSVAYNNFIGNAPDGGRLARAAFVGYDTLRAFIKGDKYDINTTDVLYAPNSSFQVWFNSNPTYAGTLNADSQGRLIGQVGVPADLPPGIHTMHLYGKDIAGQDLDLYETVYVAATQDDIDGDGVPNAEERCLAVDPINVDIDRDGIDDACDPDVSAPPADTTPPQVVGTPDRQPNASGWYGADVTINWAATDPEPGSGAPSQPAATLAAQEGEHDYLSDASCDPSGNCSNGSITLRIDKSAPILGAFNWSASPKSTLGSTTLTVATNDTLSGVAAGEYFLGDNDPGLGQGAAMQLDDNGTLSTTFGTDFPTGVYKINVRAQDRAGNWSVAASDYLVVYDPFGLRMTGKRTLIPSLANGDVLPGLVASTQNDVAKFGLNVRYNRDGLIHPNSDFQFKYSTGTRCNNPAKAQNCHDIELNATSIAWLTSQGLNSSTGIFQGLGNLTVDGATTPVIFRVVGIDGERMSLAAQDKLTLKIYPSSENPNTASPLFQVSDDVVRGNIKIVPQ